MTSPLDQSEVDALMAAIQDGRVGADPGEEEGSAPALTYDLTSQDRIIRGQMPTLDSINEKVASIFGTNLAGRTRLDLRVAPAASTLMQFGDVSSLFGAGNSVWIMSMGPGHGQAVLMVEVPLARTVLAGALGDRTARSDPSSDDGRTDLTNVERRVLKSLLGVFCDALGQGWAEVLRFRPEIVRNESDPRMAMICGPNDLTILCAYEITGVANGRIQLAIPYATVEPVKKSLISPPRQGKQTDARFVNAWARDLHNVKVDMRVEIGRAKMTFAKLLELKVGDLMMLDGSESSPLPIYVQGRPKMTGLPRVVGGSMAVVVEQGLRPLQGLEPTGGANAAPGT
ncbi:MAG TPA: FliM/FliN family flagellar motor switch protein [Polyangia bacterium]|jgi:flagellar motor switch protein FliM|nr:FliM/FliN family flagellar motor switch protein [Polyangia bacterium]